jgi:uncharacterized protein (DUF433 family)
MDWLLLAQSYGSVIYKDFVVTPHLNGKLTFDGTRILVRTVLACLASGKSTEWILTQWPQLPREAVEEAMRLAANTLLKRYDGFEIA